MIRQGIATKQAGLSLVELLIAMVIGLIIIAGVGQILLSGRQSYNTQSGTGTLQENGRFALFYLQRDIRMAGFPRSTGPGGALAVATPFISNIADASETGQVSSDGVDGASDQIVIRYQSDAAVAGSELDCLGQLVGVGAIVINRYFINDGALSCRGNGNNAPQPLINGVDSMQILYGEDIDGDTYADVYRNASQVTNWNQIASVRIALLINSQENVADTADTQEYALLDAPLLNTADAPLDNPRFRRRIFTTTIEVRNRTQ